LADFKEFDLDKLEFGPEQIRAFNPHRYEMELLNGVIALRPEQGLIIGEHLALPDAFWVRGHIPGRPLMPGVIMVELAAQLCSVYWRAQFPDHPGFFGFGGIEATRFRGTVAPGDRLIVVGKSVEV
jgi:3-hydroxyacyl-[acyl-carrier-protein] dehydratase